LLVAAVAHIKVEEELVDFYPLVVIPSSMLQLLILLQ
jgi:hypothetical protein